MTMHSAASWINQIPVLFIALINTNLKEQVMCRRTDLKCDFIMKQIKTQVFSTVAVSQVIQIILQYS